MQPASLWPWVGMLSCGALSQAMQGGTAVPAAGSNWKATPQQNPTSSDQRSQLSATWAKPTVTATRAVLCAQTITKVQHNGKGRTSEHCSQPCLTGASCIMQQRCSSCFKNPFPFGRAWGCEYIGVYISVSCSPRNNGREAAEQEGSGAEPGKEHSSAGYPVAHILGALCSLCIS